MKTVLTPINRREWGPPTAEEIEHDKIAQKHFLQYCAKCPVANNLKSWYESPCTECNKNPYNMYTKDYA